MRKIALITEAFPPQNGGSSRWFFEIYRRLPRSRVVVAAGEGPGCEAFDRTHELRVSRLPLAMDDVGLGRPRNVAAYLGLARRVRRLVREHGSEVLHCGRCLPDGWVAWMLNRLDGLPYACFVHGEEVELRPAGRGEGIMSSRQMRWMARRVFGAAECLVANSLNTRRILVEQWGLPPGKIRLLTPGVDTGAFRPARRDEGVRRRLGWEGRTVVLTVGRLVPRKGHDRMVRALRTIRSSVPDILYAIVGDGPERANLREMVEREGQGAHVQFLGEVDDADAVHCYQQCDLFALPNRQVGLDIEGFGMVLLEAQACGRPVLAGASGGTAETMRPGETGRVVPCEEPEALAEAVIDLLTDPELLDRMGRAARHWAVERFDWEALGRQARAVFDGQAPLEGGLAEGLHVPASGASRR